MSNPTNGRESQFASPYNITPDVIYTNPTAGGTQFIIPYNITPDIVYANPTIGNTQFTSPYNITPDVIYTNPTINVSQFTIPYNITPDIIYTNPTAAQTQFTQPYDILPNTTYVNPTFTNSTQFTSPFNTLPDTPYVNPTLTNPAQFTNPYDILPNTLNIDPAVLLPSSQPAQFTDDVEADPYAGVALAQSKSLGDVTKFGKIGTSIYSTYAEQAANYSATVSTSYVGESTNINGNSFAKSALGFGVTALGGLVGIPQISQLSSTVTSIIIGDSIQGKYATLNKDQLNNKVFGVPVPYSDFRARRALSGIQGNTQQLSALGQVRLDGASATTRGSKKAALYLAAAASPAGAYTIFNLDGAGNSGYGLGSQGDPYAIRNDFTLKSNVATQWVPLDAKDKDSKTSRMGTYGKWVPTRKAQEVVIPFRGDRVNVIDFKQSSLKSVYQWKRDLGGENIYQTSTTQDFIKFFFTGPTLNAGLKSMQEPDDVIVFRAIITSLSDTFNPVWTSQNMIGRADPNYHYTEYSRDLSLDFTVYASDRDEMQPIWRKLNALAGYTAPAYNPNDITLNGPWMRITIGDLFYQQPVLLNTLRYTLHDTDTTWEINIEDDPTMMQTPHRITVSCGFYVITDYLPQKNGRFYTLAKKFDDTGIPQEGANNWLSDFIGNSKEQQDTRSKIQKQIEERKKSKEG